MRLIHAADIHLGAKMDSRFPGEIAMERKEELRSAFLAMVRYAEEHGIGLILLAGDVFDSDRPFKKDKDFFYGVVRSHPDTEFLYLRGNHDRNASDEALPNLRTFSDEWTSYDYGELTVTGIEMTDSNARSLYASLALSPSRVNVVMLHGQTADSAGEDRIDLKRLRDRNIDYLALGHVHGPSCGKLDRRGEYAYSGCLAGRGFDETGDHGFYDVEISGGALAKKFVSVEERKIVAADVDVTGARDAYEAYRRVSDAVRPNHNDLYRIRLTGSMEITADRLERDVAKYLAPECYYASVKDATRRTVDPKKYELDLSVRGEFVRGVLASDLPEEERERVLAYGLRALAGEEIGE